MVKKLIYDIEKSGEEFLSACIVEYDTEGSLLSSVSLTYEELNIELQSDIWQNPDLQWVDSGIQRWTHIKKDVLGT